jgi:hypothetical protein
MQENNLCSTFDTWHSFIQLVMFDSGDLTSEWRAIVRGYRTPERLIYTPRYFEINHDVLYHALYKRLFDMHRLS